MSIAKVIKISNITILLSIFMLSAIIYQSVSSIYEYVEKENLNYKSIMLAGELRHSSRELTENFRLYIMTGNDEYNKAYWNIAKERSGIIPRSHDKAVSPGEKTELSTVIEKIIPHEYFYMVKRALMLSDDLIHFENDAMNIIKKHDRTEQDVLKAKELAYSPYYILKTHEIMSIIAQFYTEINNKSKKSVGDLKNVI